MTPHTTTSTPSAPGWPDLATQIARGTGVVADSRVSIFMTDPSAMPAVEAFVDEVYRLGGIPQVIASDERFDRSAVRHASTTVLTQPAPMEAASLEWADVHVSFRGMAAPAAEPLDAERLALQRVGKGVVSTLRWQETRWAIVRVPTPEWAALIGEDYNDLLAQFFAGCIDDWDARRTQWDGLCSVLNTDSLRAGTSVRILSPDTDLVLGTTGRSWVSFAGDANLPDGEIATAPVDDQVNGYITFPGRFWFAGAPVANLRLTFVDGLVTDATADEGLDLVLGLLDTDEGSRRVGELGIGTNGNVRTMTGDLFIDEKILGTVHIALGRAYPECGGVNRSSLHWDIVKDLRHTGGSLYAGSRALIVDGVPTTLLAGPGARS